MKKIFALGFVCNAIIASDISVEQAKSLYEDYLYYGGSGLSKEELNKYLVLPRARQLKKSRSELPFISLNIAENDHYDDAQRQQARREKSNRIEQEQILVSQLESSPSETLIKSERILGPAMVSQLLYKDRAEVTRLEKDFIQSDWVRPVILEGDSSKIEAIIQDFASRWQDEGNPVSTPYASTEQEMKKDKRNRYMALELLKRLKAHPQQTIDYLRQLVSWNVKTVSTLSRAEALSRAEQLRREGDWVEAARVEAAQYTLSFAGQPLPGRFPSDFSHASRGPHGFSGVKKGPPQP